ncbi:MAG TPA: hypothetical protein GXX14_08450 [Clostridiaceae bacterium]|nr:hypothetical protein [Clostridiaceae bacterium]
MAKLKSASVYFRLISLIPILLVLIILGASLFLSDTVGLSDNGDFKRVMVPNRIYYGEEGREAFAFTDRFKLTFEGNGRFEKLYNSIFTLAQPYVTTQNFFIKASILLNLAQSILMGTDLSVYRIQWLGVLYCLFLTVSLGMIFINVRLGRKWLDVAFFALLIFVFCDVGYTAYFNSFYGEALQYTSLIFIFACAVSILFSEKRKILYCVFYYAGVILFAGSKFANIPLGIILALAGLSFILLNRTSKLFKTVNIIGLVLVLAVSAYFFTSVPEWMDEHTTYQAVFFGVLKNSPSPEKDLEELGLPSYMVALQNTNYYMEGHKIDIRSQKFRTDFYDNVSKADVLKFYLMHPSRLWQKLEVSIRNSSHIQPVYLSNYDSGHERLTRSEKFSIWSSFRPKLPVDNIYFTLLIFIVAFLSIILELRNAFREKDRNYGKIVAIIFCFALIAINGINLLVPVITNGEADIAKHLFGYVTGIDLMLLLILMWLIYKLSLIFSTEARKIKRFVINNYKVLLVFIVCISAILLVITYSSKPKKYNSLTYGAYVSFGEYNGRKLLWKVINTDENGILLFADEAVEFRAFDSEPRDGDDNRMKYGSNYWPECTLRKWLNGEFLRNFKDSEIRLINNYKNKVLLSVYDKEKAEGGDNDFFWMHVPSLAAFGFDDAYHLYVDDKVFLLDIKQLTEFLSDKGEAISRKYRYWLETVYYNNSSMVRVVDRDGYIYMKDANVDGIGVIPALYLKNTAGILEGTGTREQPFVVG